LIVVDDGSTDSSAANAAAAGALVYYTDGRIGPGGARNIGAQHAKSEYLCFIDADCEVNEFTFANISEEIHDYPDHDAFFGSYDDSPRATNFVAQYKNLCHRFVHQVSKEEASTFWAGCGIVRRTTFLELGGFDTNKFRRPSIEDIDLGYRIKLMGGRIRLAKSVQVKHYKAWDLPTLVKTDVIQRGIPWTRLLLANPACRVNELNLQWTERLAALCAFALVPSVILSFTHPAFMFAAVLAFTWFCILNREVFGFFYRNRGFWFTLAVIPMQWLYYIYASISFAMGAALHFTDQIRGVEPFALRPQRLRSQVRELSGAVTRE
jgi:glycosyltransferase involved in cell wall biosynthesis